MGLTSVKLNTKQLLAAELHNYSYDNYADHFEIKNARFTTYMPETVEKLEKAEKENWSNRRIARELDIEENKVEQWLENFQKAKAVSFCRKCFGIIQKSC